MTSINANMRKWNENWKLKLFKGRMQKVFEWSQIDLFIKKFKCLMNEEHQKIYRNKKKKKIIK